MRGKHGSDALVIKDSLWNAPWFVESIDVMVHPDKVDFYCLSAVS